MVNGKPYIPYIRILWAMMINPYIMIHAVAYSPTVGLLVRVPVVGAFLAESYGVDDDHSGKGRDRDAQENRKRFCKEYIEASYIQIHMFISFSSNSQFANARGLNFCLRPPKKSIPAAPDSET